MAVRDPILVLGRLASFVLRLVSVPKCVVCGEILEVEGEICPSCLALWKEARETRCPKCHKTAAACSCRPFSMFSTDTLRRRPMLSLVFLGRPGSSDPVDMLTRAIVYKTKKSENRGAANFCARELAGTMLRFLYRTGENPREWIITYPPGTRQRIRRYGFDQSRQLTEKLSKYTGIPRVGCFKRVGHTMQKTLNAAERRMNAEHAYILRRDCNVQGKKVLLVDDVITTGATVNACACLLKQAGAEKVFPVSIARTKRVRAARRPPASRPWFARIKK